MDISTFANMVDGKKLNISFDTPEVNCFYNSDGVQVDMDDEEIYINTFNGYLHIDIEDIIGINLVEQDLIHIELTRGELWMSGFSSS